MAGAFAPSLANADEPAVAEGEAGRTGRTSALSWVRQPGADDCIGAPALAAAVEARLHRRVFVPPSDAEVSLEGTISRAKTGNMYIARFRVADRYGHVLGERDVQENATSCTLLDEKLALVVSLLIDPEAALGEAAPPPDASATPPPPPTAPVATAPVATAPAPEGPAAARPRPPWRWFVGLELGGAGGIVPDVGWSIAAGALITPPRLPGLRVRAGSFLPASQRLEGGSRADISLVMGELALCPLELRRAPLGLTVCAGGLGGQLSGRGSGFTDSMSTSSAFGAVDLTMLAELDLTRSLGLTLAPSLVVPVTRSQLAYVDDAGLKQTFFEVSAVGVALALGVMVGSR